MRPCTKSDLAVLLGEHEPPCVSIYLPTSGSYPASQQNSIRFRNLVDTVSENLRQKYPEARLPELQDKLGGLVEDDTFWMRRQAGLAVLGSAKVFEVFDLQRPVNERAVVADSFFLKPLMRIVQSADRYHVLCLQRDEAKIYEGNRDGLAELDVPGIPTRVEEAVGEDVFVLRRTQVPSGKSAGERYPAPRHPNAPPGHPQTRDDAKMDAERFFRAIDRAVWENLSRPADFPLVLVALPEQQAVFRSVSRNPRLLAHGIERSPAGMTEQELRVEAWKCVEPSYLARLDRICDDFRVALPRSLASAKLDEVAAAAFEARIGILLVEAERSIPGRIDASTGSVTSEAGAPDADVLDDLAELVVRRKGTVIVVPKERMPSHTGLAAIFRF